MRCTRLLIAVALIPPWVPASQAFEVSWTDQFGESVYTLSAPDCVEVGDTLEVLLTAADPLYPEDLIAGPWQFLIDGEEYDGSFGIFLSQGYWESRYAFAFEAAASYEFTFRAQDHGHGGGAHDWEWFEIAGTTEVSDQPSPTLLVTWGQLRLLAR